MDFSFIPIFWSYAEPFVQILALIVYLRYVYLRKRAEKRRYQNSNGKDFVIAVEVGGRPISEAVKSQFGELDCLINAQALVGKPTLENDKDYQKIAAEVYKAISCNQNCKVHLVLSGPIALSAIIGRMIGYHSFNVVIYQFDPSQGGYYPVPTPDRSWFAV